MKTHYIFDVDGTLTPSRQAMNSKFADEFLAICCEQCVSLVTGSNYEKTQEQVPAAVLQQCKFIFSASGNETRQNGELVESVTWTPAAEVTQWLTDALHSSEFVLRTGCHIEPRPGALNFSIVGRNATLGERQLYVDWDLRTQERTMLVKQFNQRFPRLQATIGGETGIDISERGRDKSQIIKWFDREDKLIFFGDKTQPGGNDYPLAELIYNRRGIVYDVTSWFHTRELLQILFNYAA